MSITQGESRNREQQSCPPVVPRQLGSELGVPQADTGRTEKGEEKKAETQARGRQRRGWTYDTGEKPTPDWGAISALQCLGFFHGTLLSPVSPASSTGPAATLPGKPSDQQVRWQRLAFPSQYLMKIRGKPRRWKRHRKWGKTVLTGTTHTLKEEGNTWGYKYTLPKKRSKGVPTGGQLLWSWNLGHCTVLEQTSTEMYLLRQQKIIKLNNTKQFDHASIHHQKMQSWSREKRWVNKLSGWGGKQLLGLPESSSNITK